MPTVIQQIQAIRKAMGEDLVILGHHYQASEILQCADFCGDSLELSRKAAQSTARRIVFCGVRFMAETADILTHGRAVYQPAPEAGCPMADMAAGDALERAWQALAALDPATALVPVVYVNSTADVKAFCGRRGGSACTSGNGEAVIRHFLASGARIFFAPDQHLCANIMHDLGYPDSAVALYDPALPGGGLAPEAFRAARLIAWKGCCPIHCSYKIGDVAEARRRWPGCEIMVHPESPEAVTRAADCHGSTRAIIAWIAAAADTEKTYVIGTEESLVARLAKDNPRLKIRSLRKTLCRDMTLTTPEKLLRVLESWPEEALVRVPDALVPDARLCVERMLAL